MSTLEVILLTLGVASVLYILFAFAIESYRCKLNAKDEKYFSETMQELRKQARRNK